MKILINQTLFLSLSISISLSLFVQPFPDAGQTQLRRSGETILQGPLLVGNERLRTEGVLRDDLETGRPQRGQHPA